MCLRANQRLGSFLILCTVSMPAMTERAQSKDLKPVIGRTILLIARWSWATVLFMYFDWRRTTLTPESARMPSIAALGHHALDLTKAQPICGDPAH